MTRAHDAAQAAAAELDALLADLAASGPDLGALLASLNAETDALLATLEAERPQREAELAALLAALEGDTGASGKGH